MILPSSEPKVIMLCIACLNVIFYAYVLLKVFSVYNLLHHNTGNPTYVITHLFCDMTISALSASA